MLQGATAIIWTTDLGRLMDAITKTSAALVREPLAIVMLLLTLVTLATGIFGPRQSLPRRLGFVLLGILSGVTTWMMASGYQWPR
jgi:hypothetical protein